MHYGTRKGFASIALLIVAPSACVSALADEYAIDCTSNPSSFDNLFATAVSLLNNMGTPAVVTVTGNCVSTETFQVSAAGSLSLVGTGPASSSVQINSGDGLLQVFPASGTVDLSIRGLSLTGAHVNGAIKALQTTILVTDASFSQNDGGFGGAIEADNVSLTIRNSRFSDNNSTTEGGAIAVGANGSIDIEDTTFSDNTSSTGGGGAIYATGNVSVRIATSLLRNNVTSGDGGAILMAGVLADALDVRNSTLLENIAVHGGAIAMESGGALTLENVTVFNNSAPSGGSVIFTTTDTLTTMNSLLSGTCLGLSASPAGTGNIESPGDSCSLPSGNLVNQSAGSIMLAALADNGGPTQTLLPLAGSVLVGNGAALCEPIDQRHLLRDVGACDVGATEYGATTPDLIFANGF